MEIKVEQDDLVKLMTDYLAKDKGIDLKGKRIEVSFMAGRKHPSHATIKVIEDDSKNPVIIKLPEKKEKQETKESKEKEKEKKVETITSASLKETQEVDPFGEDDDLPIADDLKPKRLFNG